MAQQTDTKLSAPLGALSGSPIRSLVLQPGALLVAALQVLLCWQARARERRHLESLDDRLLRDLGLSRADVALEADKPFWLP